MERREVTTSSAYLPAVGLIQAGQQGPAAHEGQQQESRDIAGLIRKRWAVAFCWIKAAGFSDVIVGHQKG